MNPNTNAEYIAAMTVLASRRMNVLINQLGCLVAIILASVRLRVRFIHIIVTCAIAGLLLVTPIPVAVLAAGAPFTQTHG